MTFKLMYLYLLDDRTDRAAIGDNIVSRESNAQRVDTVISTPQQKVR